MSMPFSAVFNGVYITYMRPAAPGAWGTGAVPSRPGARCHARILLPLRLLLRLQLPVLARLRTCSTQRPACQSTERRHAMQYSSAGLSTQPVWRPIIAAHRVPLPPEASIRCCRCHEYHHVRAERPPALTGPQAGIPGSCCCGDAAGAAGNALATLRLLLMSAGTAVDSAKMRLVHQH
jgi:hypothetical protein